MKGYIEVDKGRFEAGLVRDEGYYGRYAVAYTYGDEVRLCEGYCTADRKAVEEFANQYDLTVDWTRRW